MKRIFLFVLAAAAMTVACQKNQVNPDVDPLDDGTPVPVVFGTNVATVSTRAAVEESFSATDAIHVYGIKTEATTLTAGGDMFLVEDHELTAPFTTKNNTLEGVYYGANKETYSFYGYYVGGANTGDVVYGTDAATITVPVTIDGDDDLMIACTNKSDDLSKRDASKGDAPALKDLYSAKSARRGVTPKLVFNHKLVRFDFKFTDGSGLQSTDDKSVWVEKVAVSSVAEGELFINHTEQKDTLILKDGAKAVDLTAGQLESEFVAPADQPDATYTPLVKFGKDALYDDADVHATIMAMLLPEGTSEYPVKLYLGQTGATIDSNKPQVLTLTMPEGKKFEEGKKYTVTITVYGLEAVIVDVTVNPWTSGGSFTYDPDSNDGPVFVEP